MSDAAADGGSSTSGDAVGGDVNGGSVANVADDGGPINNDASSE